MQSRNKSLLKFQERLIKAAMQSPPCEAMNLMGIIYSNLEEFIHVRIPMDGDIEGCIDALIDTLDLFDYALRMKFPTLYMAQIMPIISKLSSFEDIETLYSTMVDNKLGCFINGLFYHRTFIANELAFNLNDAYLRFNLTKEQAEKLDEYKCAAFRYTQQTPFIITGSRLHVSVPPYLVRSEDIAVDVVNNWIHDQSQSYDCRITFEHHHRDLGSGDLDFNNFQVESITDKNVIISFINPLFIHFDQVAKMIISNTENRNALVYNDDIPPFYGIYYGSHFNSNHKPGRALLRTPFALKDSNDCNMVIDTVLNALNRRYPILDYIPEYQAAETQDEKNRIVERIREGNRSSGYTITSAYMSIYRTDHAADKANVEFLMLMAIMLQERCHIFIEARARDDEENNVNLAKILRELGATIHVQSYSFGYKVHAKIWHFHMLNPNGTDFDVDVYSTGNFVSSAQNGFSDTIIVDRHFIEKSSLAVNFSRYLDYLYYPNQFVDKSEGYFTNTKFIWKPGDLRQRLYDLIHYSDRGQFIWIKCNHITDKQIIKELKAAAKRGVFIRLIVRTTCTIGHSAFRVNGIRQNFAARSIVGRYLEHDRWFIFGNLTSTPGLLSEDPIEYTPTHAYISSADLMPRNLDERVEFMYENEDTLKIIPPLFVDMYCKQTSAEQGYFNITL